VLVSDRGDDPVEALTAAGKRHDLRAASLTGIGAFAAVTLGSFDHARRDYRRRVIREQAAVVSLIGNIALDRGATGACPCRGGPGGRRRAGPTLEVTLVEAPAPLRRKTDRATGLAPIDLV